MCQSNIENEPSLEEREQQHLMTPPVTECLPPSRIEALVADDDHHIIHSTRNIPLLERSYTFFFNVAALVSSKRQMDDLYKVWVQSKSKILARPEFSSMGPSSRLAQPGPAIMPVEEVRKAATKHKPEFDALLRRIVENTGLDPDELVLTRKGEPILKNQKPLAVLTTVDLKSEERCHAKTQNEYDGNAKYLCDVGRATIVCGDEDQLARVFRALRNHCEVVRIKNRFATPNFYGVRDILLNIQLSGHIFEIQLHQADMLAAMIQYHNHEYYEYFREFLIVGGDFATTKTTDSENHRMEVFDGLGEDLLNYTKRDVTHGIQSIFMEADETKLQNLSEVASVNILDDPSLQVVVLKKLLEVLSEHNTTSRIEQLRILRIIADGYHRLGKHGRAMELLASVLEEQKMLLVEHRRNIKTIKHNTSHLRKLQRSHPGALAGVAAKGQKINAKALEQQEEWIEEALIDFGTTMHDIARLQESKGKHTEARTIFDKVLRLRKRLLGETHPDTLDTMGALGRMYSNQEYHRFALEALGELLQHQQSIFGKDHADALLTMHRIARAHTALGNHEVAYELYLDVLRGFRSSRGIDHPCTLTAMSNLALGYSRIGSHEVATDMHHKVIERQTRIFGADHPDTLHSRNNMALASELCREGDGAKPKTEPSTSVPGTRDVAIEGCKDVTERRQAMLRIH